MNASCVLIERLKKFESCKLRAYQDGVGVWTIGYGHTQGVKMGDVINQAQAEIFLRQDLARFEAHVNNVRNIRAQGQFDAVLDFCYNCGTGNFDRSTLRRYIEGGRKDWEIQLEFLKWNKAGGRVMGGLVSRRIWEANRYIE